VIWLIGLLCFIVYVAALRANQWLESSKQHMESINRTLHAQKQTMESIERNIDSIWKVYADDVRKRRKLRCKSRDRKAIESLPVQPG
jgi:hypothetical protein